MAKLPLNRDEKIIMEASRGISPQDDKKAQKYYVGLVLTNKALYIQYMSIWTRAVKEVKKIPLGAISIHDGVASVYVHKIGFYNALVVITREETFEFVMVGFGKGEVKRWADTISRLLTGKDAEAFEEEKADYVGAVKDIIDAFKNTKTEPDLVNRRCLSCRAPISGYSGERVKCTYCDTEQTL